MRWEEKICSKLIRDNIVKADEKEIILYGIHQGKTLSLNILTLFFVCLIFESIWQGIVFLIMFWPLRIYAGGYHADTEFRCYLLSTMCEIIILGIGSMVEIKKSIFVVAMLLLVSILILHFAPQGNVYKLLNQQEYILYKEKVRRILTIHGLVFGTTYVIGLRTVWQTIVLSQILMLVILVVGQIKWKCHLKGKERLLEERVRNEITEKC